jgi:hypothetical protein
MELQQETFEQKGIFAEGKSIEILRSLPKMEFVIYKIMYFFVFFKYLRKLLFFRTFLPIIHFM